MRFQNTTFIFIVTLSFVLAGCFGSNPKPSTNTNGNKPVPSRSPESNTDKQPPKLPTPEVKKPVETKKVAVTLKPVVDAYCAAINKGDDGALKGIYSRASWKALTADARSEGQRSVAKFLAESEPIGDRCQVVNERISGKVAEATVITQTYPNGVPLKFVVEGGNWKMTNQSKDFEIVRKPR